MTDDRTHASDRSAFDGYPVLPHQADHRVVIAAPDGLLAAIGHPVEHWSVLALDVESDGDQDHGVPALVLLDGVPHWLTSDAYVHLCWEEGRCPTP